MSWFLLTLFAALALFVIAFGCRDHKKKAFLICPVRGHDMNELQPVVENLERKYVLYWPHRDTDQDDPIGYRICRDNMKAIKEADVVLIIWDGKSQGSLFDLGMAFALDKPIEVVRLPEATEGKSFQNMVREWERTT